MHEKYLEGVLDLYTRTGTSHAVMEDEFERVGFMVEHFLLTARYRLGRMFEESINERLRDLHQRFEQARLKLESQLSEREINPPQFMEDFARYTVEYQEAMANFLFPEQYRSLFGLEPGENVVLGDPEIMEQSFNDWS